MFQPQATPYSSSFSSYGIGLSVGNFASFQPAGGGGGRGGGVVDHPNSHTITSGPILFREEAANTHSHNHQFISAPPLHFNTTNSLPNNYQRPPQYNKMSEQHDLQAQTRAAENYERESRIEVRAYLGLELNLRSKLTPFQGPMVGEKRSSHAITEEYEKADPVYITKTRVSISACWLARWGQFADCMCGSGTPPEILALPTGSWRWQLWMAGYVALPLLRNIGAQESFQTVFACIHTLWREHKLTQCSRWFLLLRMPAAATE